MSHHGEGMLLIFPPVAKPCEPPAGIAKLSATLRNNGVPCRILDANLEGLLWLPEQPQTATDTWSRRAIKNLPANIIALKDPNTYNAPHRYALAARDINRVLAVSTRGNSVVAGLADYRHNQLSPLRSADLIAAAEQPHLNPFYPYFSKRFQEIIEPSGLTGDHAGDDDAASMVHVVGFSLNYLSQALCAFAMIGFVRERFPGIKIILGGGLVTSWMKRPGWVNPFGGLVDLLVAGPGEGPLLKLFGIEEARCNQVAPEYDSLPIHEYLSPGFILPYSSASGCYWNKCSFCPEKAEGNPYDPIPVKQTIAELHTLIIRTSPVLIHLLDNAVSPALLGALVERPLNVPWYGFARFSPELAEYDFCLALKRSGCVMLKLGLESGDQRVLDRLNKGVDIGLASQALTNLNKAGIKVYLYLLFGTPAESVREARITLAFVVRHRASISFMNLALFNMPIYGEEVKGYEIEPFYEGDLSLYTGFRHPKGWDRKQVRGFLENEFKREPAVAAILERDPPFFTSNHAAFFKILTNSHGNDNSAKNFLRDIR